MSELAAPWPHFGGKRKIAAEIWARLGDVDNYVEPFFGSGAVLLRRPEPSGNGKRERIWFSPACLSDRQGSLFEAAP